MDILFDSKRCFEVEHCYTSDLGSSPDILRLLSARTEETVLILPFPSAIVLSAVLFGSSKVSLSSIKVSCAFLPGSGLAMFNCGVALFGLVRLLPSIGITSPSMYFRVGPQAAIAARLASMFDSGVRTL